MSVIGVGEIELDCERSGRRAAAADDHGHAAARYAHWGEPFLDELRRDFELILYDHRGRRRQQPPRGASQHSPDGAGTPPATPYGAGR